MHRVCVSFLVISLFAAGAISAVGTVDPNEYQKARQLEQKGDFAGAKAAYEKIIQQSPNDPLCGADNAGFRVKWVDFRMALQREDTTAARAIADEIGVLPSSAKQKRRQLTMMAHRFETFNLFDDAATLYQRLITEYPNSPKAGPDNAGFHVKWIAFTRELERGDMAAAKTIAAEIKALASSAKEKPLQLFSVAKKLETHNLFDDAQVYYQQILTEYPNSPEAGPDNAGFRVKWVAFRTELERGDMAAAKTIAAEIKALTSSATEKPRQLYWIACKLAVKNQFDDAMMLYRQVITSYPDSPVTKAAGMYYDRTGVIKNIYDSNFAAANAATATIKVKYAGKHLTDMLFFIGEAYSLAGLENSQSDFFRQSAELFADIVTKQSDAQNIEIFYILGFNYERLGEYKKAADFCIKVTDIDPNYRSAWQSLLTASVCYEKLAADGNMPQSEAETAIRGCYKRILEKYPACPSPIKQKIEYWLKQHEPEDANSEYQVLNPSEWVGKKLPILKYIDIGEKIANGQWLLVFYHFDCPECLAAIKCIQSQEKDLLSAGQQIALIEVPPCGKLPLDESSVCILGKLPQTTQWFVETPIVVEVRDGIVTSCDKNV